MGFKLEMENFEEWLSEYIATPSTYRTYLSGVREFLKRLPEDPENLTADELKKEATSYIVTRPSAYYRKFALKYLFLYLGMEEEYLKLRKVRQPPRKDKTKNIGFDKIRRLITTTNNKLLKLIIMLQYDTSSRIGAILRIQLKDIGTDTEGGNYVTVLEKGGQIRTVYFTHETWKVLDDVIATYNIEEGHQLLFERYFKEANLDPYVTTNKRTEVNPEIFQGKNYERLYEKIWRDLKEHSENVIGFKITSHWLRHSRIIHLFRKGYREADIQQITGHKTLDSLRPYLEESGVKSKRILEKETPDWSVL